MRPDTIKIRHGSAVVKIRPVKNNGYDSWMVYYYDAGNKLVRLKRSDLEEAKFVGNEIAKRISEGRNSPVNLTQDQQFEYLESCKLLPEGVSLLQAVREFSAKRKHESSQPCKTFDEVKTEFLLAKSADNVSAVHLKDLKKRLKLFGETFQGRIDAITGPIIDDWLRGLSVAPKTRNNYRGALLSFFNFAKARQYLLADPPPGPPPRLHPPSD